MKHSDMEAMYEHQQEFLNKGENRTALVWSCGTGKTRTAIEWAQRSQNTLIICPKALKKNWDRECTRFFHKGIPWSVMIISKEEFKKAYMAGRLPVFESVVVDEVHNGFLTPNFKSQMSKCLRDYIKKNEVSRVLLLSATVYTSSPWNIFTLATLLGHKWNWRDFNWKYFYQVRMGGRIIAMPKKGVEKDMAELTKKIASVVDIRDCMDVPEQLHEEPEYFALNAEQARAIKASYSPVHSARYAKQHEIENGVLIGDVNGLEPDQFFPCDKMTRLENLVRENKKIAIVCRYNIQIGAIARHMELAFPERKLRVIQGATKKRDEITLECEAAEDMIVLIQADCAEGYQLPSFGLCVFASQSFSYAKFEQICGRFLRMDKPSRTTFTYLLTDGDSVDQGVYDSVKRKEDFQIALYGKNK